MKWHLTKYFKPKKNIVVLLCYPDGIVTTGYYWGYGQWGADSPGYDPTIDVPVYWAKIKHPDVNFPIE